MGKLKIFLVFCRLIFILIIINAKALGQSNDSIIKMPAPKSIRASNMDIKHMAIDIQFDWKKKQVYGSCSIELTVLKKSTQLSFEAGFLSINAIALNNGTVLSYEYDGGDKDDGLVIKLDKPYQVGEALTLKIDYHSNFVNESDPNNLWGSIGKGVRFFEPTFTEPNKKRQVWSAADFNNNRYWFPGFDDPGDLRTTEFTATVDNKFTVISNGVLLETKDNQNGTKTFQYRAGQPYSNCFTSFIVGEFVDIKQNYENINLHSYGSPDEKDAISASVIRLPDMIKYFSEITGAKYPYPQYSQVFVQDFSGITANNSGWQSNHTVSTITENMIDDERTHADFYYLWDLTEAEALAGQWFGNYLTAKDWSQAWLNQGFAHYMNCLYNEQKNGKEEFLIYQLAFDQGAYLLDWNGGYRHPVVTGNYENSRAIAGDNYASIRGALVLHMLRKHIGEEKWHRVIKLYVKKNAGGVVSTHHFTDAVNQVCNENLDWFFEQWLYRMGHPVFEISKVYDDKEKTLTLIIKQTQKIDLKNEYPQVDFFKGNVEVEIDGQVKTVMLEAKAENKIIFSAIQNPKLVNFDFESTWIKEITFDKTIDELIYQLENDRDILGRNWALGELVNKLKEEKKSPEDSLKVLHSFWNVALGNSYWRLRMAALSQLRSMIFSSASGKSEPLNENNISGLKEILNNENAWLRSAAITFLGMLKDTSYADIYLHALNDKSDRVINSAAIALGKTNSSKAFEVLVKLKDKPSWKNQSLISALNGLTLLGDPRGADIALNVLSDRYGTHWTLATPVWDYRITAAQTLVVLGKAEQAYQIMVDRFKKSMEENDINDIFSNVLIISILADKRSEHVFEMLKEKYKNDLNAMQAVNQYETQYKESLKK